MPLKLADTQQVSEGLVTWPQEITTKICVIPLQGNQVIQTINEWRLWSLLSLQRIVREWYEAAILPKEQFQINERDVATQVAVYPNPIAEEFLEIPRSHEANCVPHYHDAATSLHSRTCTADVCIFIRDEVFELLYQLMSQNKYQHLRNLIKDEEDIDPSWEVLLENFRVFLQEPSPCYTKDSVHEIRHQIHKECQKVKIQYQKIWSILIDRWVVHWSDIEGDLSSWELFWCVMGDDWYNCPQMINFVEDEIRRERQVINRLWGKLKNMKSRRYWVIDKYISSLL